MLNSSATLKASPCFSISSATLKCRAECISVVIYVDGRFLSLELFCIVMHFGLLCLIRTLPNALLWHCAYWTLIKACARNLHLITMHEFVGVSVCVRVRAFSPSHSNPWKWQNIHSFIYAFVHASIHQLWRNTLISLHFRLNGQL